MTSSRPWMIALAVSTAVNVFLVGGLAGMGYARLTAPPVVAAAPAPRVAAPASVTPLPPPAVAAEVPTKPVRHAAPVERPAPRVEAPDPPPTAPTSPPPQDASAPAQARPPLISAGDGLSPDSRRAFRKALGEANRKNRPLSQQARAERQAALAALGSPGYDAAEVARRLSAARALDLQARGNVEAALASYAASLPPAERAALAEGLARVYAPAAARKAAFEGPPR